MRDGQTPKVADFGIAVLGGAAGDRAGPGPGTPGYVGPEQQYGLKVDERCDQYSLAAVAYELLTGPQGRSARRSRRRRDTIRGCLAGVDEAILRGLSEDRDERFATVEEFAESLDRGLATSRPARPSPGGWPVVAGPRRSGRSVAALPLRFAWPALGRPETDVPHVGTRSGPGSSEAVAPAMAPRHAKVSPAAKAQGPPPRQFTNRLGMKMFLIQPGEFTMGSPDEDADAWADERPQHRVKITQPFYLAECEVTNRQFREFVEETGYKTEAERSGLGGHVYDAKKKNLVRDPKWTFRTPARPGARG